MGWCRRTGLPRMRGLFCGGWGCPGEAGCEREGDGAAETGGGERGVGICLYYIAPRGEH